MRAGTITPSNLSRAKLVTAKRDLLLEAAREYYASMTAGDVPESKRAEIGVGLFIAAREFVRAEKGLR